MAYQILIVEDDPKIATLVAEYLERYGYVAHLVPDFRSVEAQVLALRPHLVLMDVNLPYQDGFHLTRLIRRRTGIPEQDLGRVFEPFFTGENGRRFGGATGMGLYLVRQVMDHMGHTVRLTSRPGAGTTVTFSYAE